MIRDTVRAMIKAIPDVKESSEGYEFDPAWEVALQIGNNGASSAVQQVTRITLQEEFASMETHKGQRVVVLLDEIRGLTAEPSGERGKGGARKPGFM
jgi:hypothetical protein